MKLDSSCSWCHKAPTRPTCQHYHSTNQRGRQGCLTRSHPPCSSATSVLAKVGTSSVLPRLHQLYISMDRHYHQQLLLRYGRSLWLPHYVLPPQRAAGTAAQEGNHNSQQRALLSLVHSLLTDDSLFIATNSPIIAGGLFPRPSRRGPS